MNEEYFDVVDKTVNDIGGIMKDLKKADRIMYAMVKCMSDRFKISPEEALQFIIEMSIKSREFANSDDTDLE